MTGRPPSLGEYSGQVQLGVWRSEAEEPGLDRLSSRVSLRILSTLAWPKQRAFDLTPLESNRAHEPR